MRILLPNWEFAQSALEGYKEDGVSGKVGYDADKGEWYADLNDEEYDKYMDNIDRRHDEMVEMAKELKEKWEGVNVQGQELESPKPTDNRLTLYIMDIECGAVKSFKVLNTVTSVVNRQSASMMFGSTCDVCGKRMMAILTWEDVKPKK